MIPILTRSTVKATMELSEKALHYYNQYLASLPPGTPRHARVESWYFCDSEPCAQELGDLVQRGIKTATASLLWIYEAEGEPLPEVGGISVITDWHGEPMCIIETTRVYILPFDQVDPEQAYEEGEGDRSLEYWREVHWRFFGREAQRIGREPTADMSVICERFRLLYGGLENNELAG